MGLFGRKRMKTTDAQGRKVVVVTDKRGTVRKTKIKDKKNQITTKERYDRAGNLTKRKAKGKYIKRFKAKTSNPTFDQSVFNDNQTVRNMVSGNPILNAKRNQMLQNGTDEQKKVQNNQVQNDTTQTNVENKENKNVEENKNVTTNNVETKDTKKDNTTKEKSFGEAYREQRNKNTEAGVDHYGDDAGYFTWKGKKYNTESKEEKATRLAKKDDVIKTDDSKKSETPTDNTPDPTITPNKDNTNTDPDLKTPTDTIPKTDTIPTDTVPTPDLTKLDMDTIAKRGGSKGSYRSYRHGGAVGPNGIL
tara:strand:+ start:113 stop:1027 length:915 start_codon:yes stop_codon:yes gene_type:complete